MGAENRSISDAFPPVSLGQWRERVSERVGEEAFARLVGASESDPLAVAPLYGREDLGPYAAGYPGLPPFVRGNRPAAGPWGVCTEHDHPSVSDSAEAIRRDLERGVNALWIRLGIDQGVRVLTPGDLGALLDVVELRETAIYLEPAMDPIPVAASFMALAQSRKVDGDALRGGFGVDPLGTLARTGSLYSGLAGSLAEGLALLQWAKDAAPHMTVWRASGLPYHDAGATPEREIALTLGTAVAYLRSGMEAGLGVDEVAPRILFCLGVGGDVFAQVAKLRAARLVWSKVVAAAGGVGETRSMTLVARTGRYAHTQRDSWVNMVRGTAETFAAIVGGADAIISAPFDERIGPSDEFARRVARNTQLVLREESHLGRVADPGGGSYYLEARTEALARAAWDRLTSMEADGGIVRALMRGRVREDMEATVAAQRARIAVLEEAVVGVNVFPDLREELLERPEVDLSELESSIGRAFGSTDQRARYDALLSFAKVVGGREEAADGIPGAAVRAARGGVDIFSLGSVLRSGRASLHIEPLRAWHRAEPWERLRDASDMYARIRGRRPAACLVSLGDESVYRARLEWMTGTLAAGGVEVLETKLGHREDLADRFTEARSCVGVLCAADDGYDDALSDQVQELRDAGATLLVAVGEPGDREGAMREAGIDVFAYPGCDALVVLQSIHDALGVSP